MVTGSTVLMSSRIRRRTRGARDPPPARVVRLAHTSLQRYAPTPAATTTLKRL